MEKFSFFNSVNGDRRYKAEDWANYFNKFITNGYFPNIASNLQVIASGTNMKVTLRAGAAWINGYMYQNTTDFDLTIQTADAVNSRKDRVVLRLDHEKREIKAYVKKGTPSSSPVSPALQRDADAYELAVAEVHVRNGVVVITQEAVTDVRLNKDLCGVVNSLLQADTTMIFNQYWDWFVRTKQKYEEDNSAIMSDFRKFMEDEKNRYYTEFMAWFQNLKNVLDSNTAGNLLNEINKINDKWNATLVELDKKSQLLQHGLNVVNAPVPSPLNIEIQGRTLVNLAGTISSAWKGTNTESVVDDTTIFKYKKSYKTKTSSNGAAGNAYIAFDVPVTMSTGKNYVIRIDIRCESAAEMIATPRWDGNIFTTHNQQYSGSTEFVPMFIKINGKDLSKFTLLIETYKANFTFWVDTFVAVYDVPDDVFAKINVDPEYSGQKLADKFPYVEGIQHLNPVVNIDGTNPSYLYTNTLLAGQNGVNDVLYKEDGQWKVRRKWLIDKATKVITLLPQSVVETVQVEGNLTASGNTQVNINSGVIVREKIPKFDVFTYNGQTYYTINHSNYPTKLKHKTLKIIKVFKSGIDITNDFGVEIETAATSMEQRVTIDGRFFDPTSEYTITYEVKDKYSYTTNIIDAKVIYNQSLASTVRESVENQADTSTVLSAVQDKVRELTTKTKEYGLRLTPRRSGKDENDIFTVTEYKMANGMVRKRSVLSNPNAYGNYLTRTETEYLENGAVQKVTLLDLIYDADGNFIDEVERT
ncbi:hypothetical protein ACQVN8_25645 [Bacillus paranthracis]|uniref:hypothetical protein n=1 Tax=Bacillus paranthracis TaxID=2026186 RepID=UPI003D653688